jgi:signal transduction histidine kinase
VRIGSAIRDDQVVLWVHDQGAGVPAEDAERIFLRFVKGSDRSGGSGLGLSIVAAIADAHSGRARLAHTPSGARFEIALPRRGGIKRLDKAPGRNGGVSVPAERASS